MNLIPRRLKLPRFPFFSFGGSTAPGQCGCKCEFRKVWKFFIRYANNLLKYNVKLFFSRVKRMNYEYEYLNPYK